MYTETQRHRVFFDYDNDYDNDFFPSFFRFSSFVPTLPPYSPPSSPPFEGEEGWLSSSIEGLGVVKQLHWARDV